MDIKITRGKSTPEGTPGKLDTGEGFACDTLELPWQNNKSGISCIIPDTYPAKIWFSPHLGRNVVRMADMHGRKDCLIHNANFAGEAAGDITQVHGCTAVGKGYGDLPKPVDDVPGVPATQWGIKDSGTTLNALIVHIISKVGINGDFTVTYAWADGCEPDNTEDLNNA